MLDIGIQVKLAATDAMQQADALWNRLTQCQAVAANIKIGGTNAAASAGTAGIQTQIAALTRYIQVLAACGVGSRDLGNATQILTATITGNSQAVVASIQQLQRLVAAQNQAAQQHRSAVPAIQQNSSAMNVLWGNITRAGAAYISFQAAMRVGSEIISSRIELDRLQIGMKSIAPNAEIAANAEAFLIARSNELGLSLRTTIPEFIKMNAAFTQSGFTFTQTRQIFNDVSTATIALGLSSATVSRILYDFQEMASLGTVQMRQMRQVMMQVPGGMEIAARSMGVTTEKLHELIHAGKIDPAEFIPAFTHELANTFGKELPEATDRLEAHINRLKNALTLLYGEMGKNPGLKWITDAATMAVQSLTPNDISQERIQDERRRLVASSMNRRSGGSIVGFMGASMGVELNPQSYISDADIRAQLEMQDKLRQQQHDRVNGAPAKSLQPWKPDLDEKEQEKVDNYWKEYRSLMSETLDDEAAKRQRINNDYLEAMDKFGAAVRKGDIETDMYVKLATAAKAAMDFQQNKLADNLSDSVARNMVSEMQKLNSLSIRGMPDDMSEKIMRLYQTEANAKFDGNSNGAKDAEEKARKIVEDWQKLNGIQKNLGIEIISDDQAKRVARVNQEFDELKKTLDELKAGGNVNIADSAYANLEKARQAALNDIVPKKDPTNFMRQSASSLFDQRENLKSQLLTAQDVEQFKKLTNEIQGISEALAVKLQNDALTISEAFELGFKQAQDAWGSASERMAKVGSSLANSLESNLTGALTGIAEGTETPEQAFKRMALAIINDMIKVIIEVEVVQPLLQAIGVGNSAGGGGAGVAGGIIGGLGAIFSGIFGGGGNVASVTGSYSSGSINGGFGGVSGGYDGGGFDAGGIGHHGLIAPRFHAGGVLGDETNIVARKGEGIFTPDQMKAMGAAMGGGGKSKPVRIMNFTDPRMVERELTANPDMILNIIAKNPAAVRAALA